ncbi:MAG: hypothetical protein V1793_24990 [Pseudomonadota bacterium]
MGVLGFRAEGPILPHALRDRKGIAALGGGAPGAVDDNDADPDVEEETVLVLQDVMERFPDGADIGLVGTQFLTGAEDVHPILFFGFGCAAAAMDVCPPARGDRGHILKKGQPSLFRKARKSE